jgi:CHASE2 domain-containing sensor protein
LRLQVIKDYLTKTITFEVFKQICSASHQQLAKVARRNANARISRLSKTPKITSQESNRSSTKKQPINSNSVITFRQFPKPPDQQLKRDFPRLTTSAKATPQPTSDANKCYICENKEHYAP